MKRKRANANRHSRKCGICNSPDRDLIEAAYVGWERPIVICKKYKIRFLSSLQAHCRALRLDERRDGNVRRLLSNFLESGLTIKPSPSAFVQAVAILSKLNEAGRSEDISKSGGVVGNA